MKAKIIFSVLGCSYNLCLIGGLVSFILYAYGLDKCKHGPTIAIGIYLVLSILGECLLWLILM